MRNSDKMVLQLLHYIFYFQDYSESNGKKID